MPSETYEATRGAQALMRGEQALMRPAQAPERRGYDGVRQTGKVAQPHMPGADGRITLEVIQKELDVVRARSVDLRDLAQGAVDRLDGHRPEPGNVMKEPVAELQTGALSALAGQVSEIRRLVEQSIDHLHRAHAALG